MTTSITDARYNVLHHTSSYTSSLLFDEPPETGWSVMPGFDESINIPIEYEPPRFDSDETLPNQIHPSYPFGRPASLNRKGNNTKNKGISNLLGTLGSSSRGMNMNLRGGEWSNKKHSEAQGDDSWHEWGLDNDLLQNHGRKEIPPGMAGAKRPPSPPSPALHPSLIPAPRSQHLRRLIERQQSSPIIPNQGFDAPVPNETYDEPNSPNVNAQQDAQQQQQQQQQVSQTQQPVPVQMGQIGSSLGGYRGARSGLTGMDREDGDDESGDEVQEDNE
ncbi:uncharacterized protein L201_003687 [Kwoniella dendrophila CBS 6074]|uniref:Anaphase-promoting complex subunit 13 n=1 Tax=Kwoniella dendrophila CBS 6074 TaxID=1295534 RepID=A0AAX4JV50_9TREE